jgi:AcrR family transcriptional regulator
MTFGTPDVRTRKRERTRAEILAAAWELVRRDGIAGLSLRDLAAGVGMRAPSLYTYFPSKNALFDAMFAQGMRQFAEQILASPPGRTAAEALRNRARTFVRVAVEDPFRYQLLFQRPIPGFAPSDESLAIGLTTLASTREIAEAAGLRGQGALDLFMATTHGIAGMQIANEPGGDRWARLAGEAVDMLVAQHAPAG